MSLSFAAVYGVPRFNIKKKKNKMVVINITFFDHSLLDILCASMSRSRRKRVTDLALQGYIRSIYR